LALAADAQRVGHDEALGGRAGGQRPVGGGANLLVEWPALRVVETGAGDGHVVQEVVVDQARIQQAGKRAAYRQLADAGPAVQVNDHAGPRGCVRAHAARHASKPRRSFSSSSSRPMKTSRVSCVSPSFHGRWWSPSTIMWTPCTT